MDIPTPLARYNHILEVVSTASEGLSLTQLVEQSGLPKSTAHRLASSLSVAGYLAMQADGRYILGPALMELLKRSFAASAKDFLPRTVLSAIASELGETAFFARRIDKQIEMLDVTPPEASGQSYVYPAMGQQPIDACSSSKAILAYVAREVAQEIYESYKGGVGACACGWSSFSRTLDEVRAQGFAICDGEIDEGVFSIACPVPVGNMSGLFCMGVVGPTARMKEKTIERLQRVLQAGAEKVSHAMAERMFLHESGNDNGR